eukprot:g1910.t1
MATAGLGKLTAREATLPYTRKSPGEEAKERGRNIHNQAHKEPKGGSTANSWKKGSAGIPTGWRDISMIILDDVLKCCVQGHVIGTITRRANTRARKFYYVVYQAAYPDPGLMTKEGFPANTSQVFDQLADATATNLVSYTDAHASAMSRLQQMEGWSEDEVFTAAWSLIYNCSRADAAKKYYAYIGNRDGTDEVAQAQEEGDISPGVAVRAKQAAKEQAQAEAGGEAEVNIAQTKFAPRKDDAAAQLKAIEYKPPDGSAPTLEVPALHVQWSETAMMELIMDGDVRKACLRYGFKDADEFNKAKKELQSAIGYLDQRMTSGTFTKHTPAAAKLPVQARKPQRADIVEKNTSAAATGSVPKPSSKKPVSLTNPTLPDARESSSSSIGSSASVKRGTVVREDGSGSTTARGRSSVKRFKTGNDAAKTPARPTSTAPAGPAPAAASMTSADLMKLTPGTRKHAIELKKLEAMEMLTERQLQKQTKEYDPDQDPDDGTNATGIPTVAEELHSDSDDKSKPEENEEELSNVEGEDVHSSDESTNAKLNTKTRRMKNENQGGLAVSTGGNQTGAQMSAGRGRSAPPKTGGKNSAAEAEEPNTNGDEFEDWLKDSGGSPPGPSSKDGDDKFSDLLAVGGKQRGRGARSKAAPSAPAATATSSKNTSSTATSSKDTSSHSTAPAGNKGKEQVMFIDGEKVIVEDCDGPTEQQAGEAWEQAQDQYGETYEPKVKTEPVEEEPAAEEPAEAPTEGGETGKDENGIDMADL